LGAPAVLIKGGHLNQKSEIRSQMSEGERREAVDLLDDDGHITVLKGGWIAGGSLRGTGCMLSSAIAAGLANGKSLVEAVQDAKVFVAEALQNQTQLLHP